MIVKWKRLNALEYTATSEGRALSLAWDVKENKWAINVDGRRTKERFGSPAAAMDYVDWYVNKYVVALGAVVHATQGHPSAERIVRHAVN